MAKKNKQAKGTESGAAEEASFPVAVAEKLKVEAPKVHFDAWYALRESRIPAIHKKEIIKADFLGRKIAMAATVAEFDEALRKYGVTL